jgi:hypothetical protein
MRPFDYICIIFAVVLVARLQAFSRLYWAGRADFWQLRARVYAIEAAREIEAARKLKRGRKVD